MAYKTTNRREFIGMLSAAGISAASLPNPIAFHSASDASISVETIKQAEKILGLKFTMEEREEIVDTLNSNVEIFRRLRALHMQNLAPQCLVFDPLPPGKEVSLRPSRFRMSHINVQMPARVEDLAFYPLTHLAALIRTQQVSSTDLTRMYLARLRKFNPLLNCVVTLTDELALQQARRADQEIAAGNYRGPLHGIPWGVKDLFATTGYRTAWGASLFMDQVLDMDATVVKKLEEAGAVLVAKLSVGELATGDRWFGGRTMNPWNPSQYGSGGSSAGSAAATAAGLVGFSIGTETTDSLLGPARWCGVSALRPTFGRVSRRGVMSVCWTLDKIGPICRSAEDCALVFQAIHGPDNWDPSVKDLPFNWDCEYDIANLRVGYIEDYLTSNSQDTLTDLMLRSYRQAYRTLESMPIELRPVRMPEVMQGLTRILIAPEVSAAFDEIILNDLEETLTNSSWANTFRYARFIPAVEYLQANRARSKLIQETDRVFDEVDVVLGNFVALSNVTGLPEVVVPSGFDNNLGVPGHINFTGRLFHEAQILALAHAYQKATNYHLRHPEIE